MVGLRNCIASGPGQLAEWFYERRDVLQHSPIVIARATHGIDNVIDTWIPDEIGVPSPIMESGQPLAHWLACSPGTSLLTSAHDFSQSERLPKWRRTRQDDLSYVFASHAHNQIGWIDHLCSHFSRDVLAEINIKGLCFGYQAFWWSEGDAEGPGRMHDVVKASRLAELAVQKQFGWRRSADISCTQEQDVRHTSTFAHHLSPAAVGPILWIFQP
jgi:hypothetical protein